MGYHKLPVIRQYWAYTLYIFVRGFRIRTCIWRLLNPRGLKTKIIINQIHLYTFGGVLLSRKGRRGGYDQMHFFCLQADVPITGGAYK